LQVWEQQLALKNIIGGMQLFVCPSFQGPSPKQVLLLPEIIHATCVGMRLWTWDLQNNEQKHIYSHAFFYLSIEGGIQRLLFRGQREKISVLAIV
jgi:hypothetical protein